ncbi:hypothetical protein GTA08_BOTSDO12866 [Neofusicoccum parvum]|nr:hypothetical protein GTA08_BOTSDO12866 [Neofusicoccum parvum]
MIETQMAMNIGECLLPEIEPWLDVGHTHAIDPFFGCSVLLPKLMVRAPAHPNHLAAPNRSQLKAAQLSSYARHPPPTTTRAAHTAELHRRAALLQADITAATPPPHAALPLAITCGAPTPCPPAPAAALAAAEIFRHALHIHVERVAYGSSAPLSARAGASLGAALRLLQGVHDASGPLSNLGWALVVVGAEAEGAEVRQLLRGKWRALHGLGLDNSRAGERVVLEFWRRRDGGAEGGSWMDVVRGGGEGGSLVPLV